MVCAAAESPGIAVLRAFAAFLAEYNPSGELYCRCAAEAVLLQKKGNRIITVSCLPLIPIHKTRIRIILS